MITPEVTVGYWSIKGLAAPLRMMVMHAGATLDCINYDIISKPDGGWDGSCWFDAKIGLKEIDPFINLPYVIDNGKIISQSNACLLHLGRKFNMLGDTPDQLTECEVLLCEIMDIRNAMVKMCYDPTADKTTAENLMKKMTSKNDSFSKIELWLSKQIKKGHSGTYLVGEKASAPDFHLWEMLDQYNGLCEYYSFSPFLDQFPHLKAFKHKFELLSQNQKYLTSPLHRLLPYNNKMASFGASITKEKWIPGQEYDFAHLSGKY